MPETVTKRDGSKQPFDMKKIESAVRKAGEEAKAAATKIAEAVSEVTAAVTEKVGDRAEVSTKEIRTWVLGTLDRAHKEIADAWRAYDQKMGK